MVEPEQALGQLEALLKMPAQGYAGHSGATKTFVIARSHSLQHELADKGIRIQAVLPAATATEFWDLAASHARTRPRRSSCRRKMWSMQRWLALTRANWLRFPASMMETN
jgi:short-subunit dehydrogenase